MISVVAMHNIGNITKHSNYYEAESTWAHTNREREIIALMCLKVAVYCVGVATVGSKTARCPARRQN